MHSDIVIKSDQELQCPTNIRIKLKLIINFKNRAPFSIFKQKDSLRHEMAFIRNVMIYTGVLLLVAHYSIGNPVPRHRRSDQNQASESTCTKWTPDTNSTEDSVTQIINGIAVYTKVTPPGGTVLSEPSLVCIINIASEYILLVWCISVYSAAGC